MPLVQQLFQLFRPEDPPPENPQDYREALLDLLVWTMFVDRHVALAERETLDEMAEKLEWTGKAPLPSFIHESTARARKVIDEGGASASSYLANIASRVSNEKDRRRILNACSEIVGADGKLRPEEAQHLKAIEKAFEL